MKYIIYILFFTLSFNLTARKEVNIWYFGERAGLDFNSGNPVAILDGQINSNEGCATLSDRTGKLLFYTDGISVWNKNHEKMPNGTGLMGHNSSTQSAVIVLIPGSEYLFYIFTVDDKERSGGFRYTLVDLRMEDGLGDVVNSVKNVLLFAPSAEKIAAVNNHDCSGVWVISHEWNSNAFRAYLITNKGIDTIPVISNAGIKYEGSVHNKKGYLKAHSDGSRLAAASGYTSTFEVFDFDNISGGISNPVRLSSSDWEAYGVEFSPDGTKLYTTANDNYWWDFDNRNELWQFDLKAGNQSQIASSRRTIAWQDYEEQFGALQQGPDGKIYVARQDKENLGVINNPNERGSNCNYVSTGVSLGGRKCVWGLPFFIQSYFDNRSFVGLPKKKVKVDTKNLKVPLTAKLNCGNTDTLSVGFEATITCDARIFYVKEILGCNVISNNISKDGIMTMKISGDSFELTSEPLTLATLKGDILLGADADTTLLEIVEFQWIGNSVLVDTVDGLIEIYGVCMQELRKISIIEKESLSVLPNPAHSEVEIIVKSGGFGNYKTSIYNVSGIRVWENTWQSELYKGNELKLYPDVSGLPNGVYIVHYQTPFNYFSEKLIIFK
ncbi:T9SS type A sorting domain-containing protein [Bacteroidota bacterium]